MSEAMRSFRQADPHLVITDISLHNGSGIELIKQLIAVRKHLKVLVCSMHDEMLFAERSLRAGAIGYVSKSEATDQLILALERVKEGRIHLSERMAERMIGRQIGATVDPQRSAIETLSDRELEVFEQIGRGETTRHIAEMLNLSRKTIDAYREKIKSKLNLTNASELTQHAVLWVLGKT